MIGIDMPVRTKWCWQINPTQDTDCFLPSVEGEIFIEGKPLKDYTDAELAKMIGVVLTEKLAINNMSVDELVGMGRSPYTGFWGHMNAYDKKVVSESIKLVGIENLRCRMVQTLSDGERQKVMIAKALAQETPIIFLDEPTAFLDYPKEGGNNAITPDPCARSIQDSIPFHPRS